MNSPKKPNPELEGQYKALFHQSPLGVFVYDNNYKITECNKQIVKILRTSRENLIGLDFQKVKDQRILPAISQGLKGKNAEYVGYYQATTSDVVIWAHLKISPLLDNSGKVIGGIGSFVDLTDYKKAEIELEKNEKQYRDLFNSVKDAILVVDNKLNITNCNPAFSEMFGYSIKQIKGKKAHMIYADRDQFRETGLNLKDYITKRNQYSISKYRKKSGKIFTGETNLFLLKNEDGETTGFIGLIRDISEKVDAEKALRESEEKYRLIVETTTDGLLIFDSKGKIVEANKSANQMHGYEEKEMIGLSGKDIVDKKDLPKFQQFLTDTAQGKEFYSEAYDIKKDGTRFPIDVKGIYFPYKGKTHMLAVLRDITERKQNEEKLKESETKYRNIFEKANVGIFQTTSKGYLISANNEMAKMLGYKNKNELFASLKNVERNSYVNPDKRKEFLQIIKNQGFVENFEYQVYRKDGTKIWVLENSLISKKLPDGDFIIDGFAKDITDQKNANRLKNEIEVAKRTSLHKDQFLANVSHEIRTPLTGIIGMTDILNKTDLDEQQEDYLNTIKESSELLINLINDILDIAKIEAGKMELNPKPFELKKSVYKIINFFKPKINQNKVSLNLNTDKNLPDIIITDKVRFEQILMNLLSNACKFTAEGSITINIKLLEKKNNIASIKIDVIDTGIGIKEEHKNKLFSKFSQVDASNTRAFEGSGLGLSICRELINLMDGDIGFTSKENMGSDFWFTFYAPITDKKTPIEKPKTETEQKSINLNLNILVAEDKIVNQKVLKLMLEKANCRVDFANNGLEALEIYTPEKHDLIIMDIMMPQMDGITALKELKKKYKNLPPVIGLSAHTMAGDPEKYIAKGLDDYITKPVTTNELYAILLKWQNKTKNVPG